MRSYAIYFIGGPLDLTKRRVFSPNISRTWVALEERPLPLGEDRFKALTTPAPVKHLYQYKGDVSLYVSDEIAYIFYYEGITE
jgi:hypothetical protein